MVRITIHARQRLMDRFGIQLILEEEESIKTLIGEDLSGVSEGTAEYDIAIRNGTCKLRAVVQISRGAARVVTFTPQTGNCTAFMRKKRELKREKRRSRWYSERIKNGKKW